MYRSNKIFKYAIALLIAGILGSALMLFHGYLNVIFISGQITRELTMDTARLNKRHYSGFQDPIRLLDAMPDEDVAKLCEELNGWFIAKRKYENFSAEASCVTQLMTLVPPYLAGMIEEERLMRDLSKSTPESRRSMDLRDYIKY